MGHNVGVSCVDGPPTDEAVPVIAIECHCFVVRMCALEVSTIHSTVCTVHGMTLSLSLSFSLSVSLSLSLSLFLSLCLSLRLSLLCSFFVFLLLDATQKEKSTQ